MTAIFVRNVDPEAAAAFTAAARARGWRQGQYLTALVQLHQVLRELAKDDRHLHQLLRDLGLETVET